MVLSVHYLRGLAALLVVCFHYRYYLNASFPVVDIGDILFSNGAYGVDLFFIISGFIICYSTERIERFPAVSFAMKRFFRIYPLLFVSLILSILFFDIEGHSLPASFVPLHADYEAKGPTYGFHLHSPVWTLTYEIAFYMLFMGALMCSQRYRKLIASASIIGLFLGLQYMVHGEIGFSAYQKADASVNKLVQPLVAIFSSPMVIEFALGIALYVVYRALPRLAPELRQRIAIPALIVAAVAAIGLYLPTFYGHGPLNWGLPAFILLLALLVYEKQNGLPEIKSLVFLGNISFSLYLMHMIIIKLMRKHEIAQNSFGLVVFFAALVASIFVSYLSFVFIEQKSAQLCRSLLKKLQSSRLGNQGNEQENGNNKFNSA
ncbi:MAG TPA: acyltransferase [Paenalcaligenes sp.]|nr:acyltransferase [Paenalcaligenes sp.]